MCVNALVTLFIRSASLTVGWPYDNSVFHLLLNYFEILPVTCEVQCQVCGHSESGTSLFPSLFCYRGEKFADLMLLSGRPEV